MTTPLTHRVPSRILGEIRLVRALVPRDARDVLILNDGQNVFTVPRTIGTAEKWRADRAARGLRLAVFAVDHAGRRRAREYLPYPNPGDPLGRRVDGGRYASFVVDELLGWIARRYPALARPRHTGIGGSSYGAVSALHISLSRAGTFDRLLLESPALYIGERRLLDDALDGELRGRIYIGVGTRESRDPAMSARVVDDALALARILREKGFGARRLRVRVDEGGRHRERHWAERLEGALRFLFE